MDRTLLKSQLVVVIPEVLVDELLAAHDEAINEYYHGGLRLSAVEGGRFCEEAFRILEHITQGQFTAIGKQLDTEGIIRTLANLPSTKFADAIRLHIPRSLRLVYDIRNKRDAAHLADGIDPNLQDATLVIGILNWVLAEFVRIYHQVSANEASRIVDELVEKTAPLVQDFDGFLKVLNPKLRASDCCLVLLYQRGKAGATLDELRKWVIPKMKANIVRTLDQLVNVKAQAHFDGEKYYITRLGELDLESRRLLNF